MSRKVLQAMSTKIPSGLGWVDPVPLRVPSVVDSEYLARFRRQCSICEDRESERDYELVAPDSEERVCFPPLDSSEKLFFYAYDCFFSKLSVRLPFTDLESEVLWSCNLAPTQLHPNSWAFLKLFQLLCQFLGVSPSISLFSYLFVLTKPGSGGGKVSWVSFRANQGRKFCTLYDESFHDFKNYYFKVRATGDVRPFFLDESGEPSFPLCWQENVVSAKYTFESLDEVEQAFVGVVSSLWGRAPHLDTKKMLGDPSLLRSELGSSRPLRDSSFLVFWFCLFLVEFLLW